VPAPPTSGNLITAFAGAGNQGAPELAALPNGNFVALAHDQDSSDVLVRIIRADGVLLTQRTISTSSSTYQNAASIAVLADGRFVVAYEDIAAADVKLQVFDINGAPFGAEITAVLPGEQRNPAVVAIPATGRFSVAFTDSDSTPDDVMGVGYNADGTVFDSAIFYSYFNNATNDSNPGMAVFANGTHATAYKAGSALKMTYVSADFTVYASNEITVSNSVASFADLAPHLAVMADGNLIVAWATVSNQVYGRVYDQNGNALTGEFEIAASGYPSGVAALPDGGFLVTYSNATVTASLGRIYDAAYQPTDVAFAIMENAGNGSSEGRPSTTVLADGRIAIAVQASNGTDNDVFVQIYDPRTKGLSKSASSFADNWVGSAFSDTMFMGGGNDFVRGGGAADFMFGEAGDDTLYGEDSDDRINGGTGSDLMAGGVGNDYYWVNTGGDGTFELAGEGVDTVRSTVSWTLANEVDKLYLDGTATNGTGNALVNFIFGNASNNVLNGLAGADRLYGLGGNDEYEVDSAGDLVVESIAGAAGGTDTVNASVNHTLSSNVENLNLTSSANVNATGNNLANTITGNSGNNFIDGKAGNDMLTGNGGNDQFLFTTALNAATNVDTITDFDSATDFLRLDDAIFTQIATGFLDPLAFELGAVADTAGDRIVYDQSTGDVFYDRDGVGGVAQVRFANIGIGTVLGANDIFVF
jgi:Ca2+-binding RTX toxin-like protein